LQRLPQASSPPRCSSSATRSSPGAPRNKNIGYIAEYLTAVGIDLKEVRVVGDEEGEIVGALNALRSRYTYVFTTGASARPTTTSPPTASPRRSRLDRCRSACAQDHGERLAATGTPYERKRACA